MATAIQIKRSLSTNVPPNSTLVVGEQAYSYSSNTLYIGAPDGTGIIAIGGKYYIDTVQAAFNHANAAFLAANTGTGLGSAFAVANAAIATANAAIATSNAAFASANAGQATANASYAFANSAHSVANAAFNFANTRLATSGGTITGSLSIVGSLTVSGNSYVIDAQNLRVSDPLIYLAGNNYTSDIVDIGFIANYMNSTGQNVHTGLYREHETKEYYLFQGYDQEPANNHIGAMSNNMTLAMLNADLKTSNLILGGANAIVTIGTAFSRGNAALASASAGQATANASYAFANSAHSIANLAFTQANNAFAQANAASAQAANADFLTTGTVSSARISGSYTGITGVGTIAAGTWEGNTIKVPYGGTGMVTFTTNGILYGNAAGDLKVTAAGTEGQVLQASSSGVPQFGMLDGGTF